MDRLEEWRLFAAVATGRSFVAAARKLGRSPQAATRAVNALEERLGERLLRRTTRSVSLTDAGARALERCRSVLADFEQLESGEQDQPLRGGIGVTAPALFGQLHVAPIVTEFLRTQPGCSVRLLLIDRPVSFSDEGIDVGIRIGALPDSELRARVVGKVRSVLCASPDYLRERGTPRSVEELARHDCIAFAGTTPISERWSFGGGEGGRERSVPMRPRLSVNSAQAAIDAAIAGLGIVRMLSYQVAGALESGSLRAILDRSERESIPVHVLQPPGAPVRAATAFAELAVARLKSQLLA